MISNQNILKRLWNELSIAILKFLLTPEVKGGVSFDFYTEFVKRFQKNIDQIKLLKIIKEVITSLPCNLMLKDRNIKIGLFASFLIKIGIYIINEDYHSILTGISLGHNRLQLVFKLDP